ncbi:MAG: DUF1549 domain-containing protein, partial [Planctomycetota bacterium]|nr:DUF1549 domain-containing protein [Planctomycetota bacterium]
MNSASPLSTVFMKITAPLILFVLLVVTPMTQSSAALANDLDFSHDVVPVLQKHCARCHTNGTYKGGLSLDNRKSLLRAGVVEVGRSAKSVLIEKILSPDQEDRMPPEGDRLGAKEIGILKTWIDEGLVWQPGFTFKKQVWKAPIRPRKPTIPPGVGNPVDYLVNQYFLKNKIKWPEPASDALFLRRMTLDLIGLLPDRHSVARFTESSNPKKRLDKVNETLARNQDFADHWLTFWNDHLRNDYVGTGYIDGGRKQITAWLYQSLYQNKPYNQFAQELIHPTPESEGFIKGIKWRGNVNASQVRELQFAQSVAQVFLGENLKCASCHNSFINDWKLEDAYGLAAVVADRPLEMFRCDKPTGQTAKIKFLWPELGAIDPTASKTIRLKQTAELVTGKQNGRFTRTIVNRIWKRMMGRGLVEPVDTMGNQPWNEDLLDYLAVHLEENGYDLKKTMSLIANSKIYQS